MLNFIIFGVLAAVCFVSIIVVAVELFMPKNTNLGRIIYNVRVRLREKSRTSFCVTAMVLLTFGLVFDGNMHDIFVALGVMLLTLIVLHPEDFIAMFRTRKKAKKLARLEPTAKLAGEAKLAKFARELEPIIVDAVPEKGNK